MGVEIAVEGLTKSFGRSLIWKDVTLTLPAGEISVMLGPSGTGKSVFLKTLVGLLKPEAGSIVINGRDLVTLREAELYEVHKVLGLVALALVLTAAALTVKARGEDRTERARTEAVAAAESRAVDLLSYDYRHLDRDFSEGGLTGQFADDYTHTTETVVRPTAEQVHAVVKAEVVSSSVVRAAQNKVVVLLFVNQTTTSTRVQGPQVDLNRVRMTLTRVGDDWKISAVTAL